MADESITQRELTDWFGAPGGGHLGLHARGHWTATPR